MPEDRIGTRLGAYRIDRLIGRGGMGMVYLAEHVHLGRKVALKILPPDLAADASFRKRFVRESQLAAAMEHPNIIPVYDAGETEGDLFIAMRYVEGTDLRALLDQRAALEPPEALALLGQVAAALDAAHREGLVHRDVKPGNILITPTQHVYLSDFGLTKRTAADTSVTATGYFVGTMNYAAPEQIEGRDLDGRTDQYALGCVAFECLTGRVPYVRDSDVAVLYAHLHEPPPRAAEERPDLHPAVDDVLSRAMAKSREQRYPTCAALVEALRGTLLLRAIGETAGVETAVAPTAPAPPLGATRPAKTAPVPQPPTVEVAREGADRTAPVSPGPPPREGPPRRRRWAWPAAILGVAVAAAIAVFLVVLPTSPPGGDGNGETPPASPPATGSAAEQQIVFLRPGDGDQYDIYVMNVDGSGRRPIHNDIASGTTPSWSPDRRQIVFDGEGEGDAEIYQLNMEPGGRLKRLTDNETEDVTPSWSPDGAKIAYASNEDGDFDIWVMDADGDNAHELFDAPEDQIRPSWSPDGDVLVFEDNRSGNDDIYVVDATGENEEVPILTDPSADTAPEWSPQEASIVFRSNRSGNLEIYTMNPDGTNLQRLTNTAAEERAPTWSPNGKQILFHSNRDGDMDIWIMNADGTDETKLTRTTGNEFGAAL